ncbi:hypothetical protein F2Q69_00058546 [Brassica cretica]|uniref:Uncharacterized protein n=1 Tax=Brassica cretica TaxID=69181 RepID=A0A8S9RR00_BRACR|nr:hypothetical protein F2Q69_00058546 [Brassica cretica]
MNYVVELYDSALKETISKLKQSDRLTRARDTALNRKTSESRAAIDKAAAEHSRLLAEKKAQKEKFMEKVERSEDETTPLVLDPAPSTVDLVVSEESLIPILGVSGANPTPPLGVEEAGSGPVDPLKLSDSLAEEEGVAVQEHEVVSRVERSEDETAPLVLVPAPSMANLVVSEESLIPILGVSDANPTPLLGSGPVDLLELLDSSAEEEGGEKSDEGRSGRRVDAGTAASLQTPTSSQGDHATERSNEPTGRELGESSVQEHKVVSRVERSEDETALLVLDPAPSMANLVVTEEECGEKLDERIPEDNPQGTEEGVVDEVENPPASTTDEAGGTSDQLEARVAEEDLDRVEN